LIRQAEQAEVDALQERERLDDVQAYLVPNQEPRRPAAWTQALNEAVEQALAQPDLLAPAGVSASDWERVLQVHETRPTLSACGAWVPSSSRARS
jgi:hypothetical protein